MTVSLGLSRLRSNANNPRIIGPTRCVLEELFRMQNFSKNFEAIDNARTWSSEMSAGVDGINLTPTCRGPRIETGSTLAQSLSAPCNINIAAAKVVQDDLPMSVRPW